MGSSGAIVSFDHHGVIISVDENFTNLFGFSIAEARGQTLQSLIFPSPYDYDFMAALEAYPQQGFLWQRAHTTEVKDRSGRQFCASVTVLVITERVDPVFVLQIYKNAESKCSVTFMDDGVIVSSSNSELVLQYPDRELIQKKIQDLLPGVEALEKAAHVTFQKMSQFDAEVLRKDGSLVPMTINVDRIKIAEKQLIRAFFCKMDLNKEAVLIIDENENIHQCNANFIHELFGYEAREILGRNLSVMFPSLRLFERSSAKRKKISSEHFDSTPASSSCDIRHKDGTLLPVMWNILPLDLSAVSTASVRLYIMRIARLVNQSPRPSHQGIVIGDYVVNLDATIGCGTYGTVRFAKHLETDEEVAVKILDKSAMDPRELERALREIEILKQLDHPNIVKLYDVVHQDHKVFIFMEYIPGGSLKQYLDKENPSFEQRKALFRQMVEAIHHCHMRNIIHRDIKHANILVAHGNVKLIDFGLSNFKPENRLLATFCGSPAYAAPEMLQGTQYLGPEVDVWSLGVVFYSMVVYRLPFENLTEIISGKVVVPPELPSDCADLLMKMLAKDPEQRASLEDVLNHPCFYSVLPPCQCSMCVSIPPLTPLIQPLRSIQLSRSEPRPIPSQNYRT